MEDCKVAKAETSVLERECEALETELEKLDRLLDSLGNRLAPALLTSPQDDSKADVSQAMSPLCTQINGWRNRVKNASGCVNRFLEELQI